MSENIIEVKEAEETFDEMPEDKKKHKTPQIAGRKISSYTKAEIKGLVESGSFERLSVTEKQFLAAKLKGLSYEQYRVLMDESRGNPDFVEIDLSADLKG